MIKFIERFLYRVCFTCRRQQSRTVRYAFPVLFTALSLVGAALILPNDASYIRIESDVSAVSADDEFSIDIYAGAHVPINAVNVTLRYPTDKIEVIGIDTGRSVITIWTQEPYVEDNKVILSGGTYRKGFLGEHLIATVDVRALESGRAEFITNDIRLLAGDGTGTEVSVSDSNAQSLIVLVDTEETIETGRISAIAELVITTDINGDGKVGLDDIAAFMKAWRSSNYRYDFNGDHRMSFVDFAIILADSFYK